MQALSDAEVILALMEIATHRLAAMVTDCDRALERLAGVVHPEVDALRSALEQFRDDARRRLAAVDAR